MSRKDAIDAAGMVKDVLEGKISKCEQCGCNFPEWKYRAYLTRRIVIICERCLPQNHPVRFPKTRESEGYTLITEDT